MTHRPFVVFLVFTLLAGEALTWLYAARFSEFETLYRGFHLLQMVILLLAAFLLGKQLQDPPWKGLRWLILLGLAFSFVGDVINSFLIDLSHLVDPQTLLSVVPFALAHCLYIAVFWRLGRSGEKRLPMALLVLTLLVWPVLAASLWLMVVDYSAGPLLKWLSLGYAHMVVLMALVSLWPLKSIGRAAWFVAAGGLVFLLSDAFFGAWLTEGQDRPLWVSQLIWASYFLAQLCIMHVPLAGQRLAPPESS